MTDQIGRLVALARQEGDMVGEQFLGWFLKEQLEETSSMAALLTMMERAAASNLLLAEEYLARSRAADPAESDPSAPPIAGGAA